MKRSAFLAVLGALPLVGSLLTPKPTRRQIDEARMAAAPVKFGNDFYYIGEDGIYVIGPDNPLHKISTNPQSGWVSLNEAHVRARRLLG